MEDSIYMEPYGPAEMTEWSSDSVYTQFSPVLDTALIFPTPQPFENEISEKQIESTPSWLSGMMPEDRPVSPGISSGFILAIAVVFVVILFNFRNIGRMTKFYLDELVNVRHGRDNVFDERPESVFGISLLLIVLYVLSASYLLTAGIAYFVLNNPQAINATALSINILIVGIYVIFQAVSYSAVGYTFASPEGRREWMRGFSSSQALLGMILIVPAICTILFPRCITIMAVLSFFIFVLAKTMCVLKGFRIFYDNFLSLLYFILYLCTLEIIPIILVYKCSVFCMI